MEAAGHERIVVRSVAERHEFDAAIGVVVGGGVRDVLDDVAEQFDGIHVDTGFGGAHVDGRAYDVGFGQRLRQGADEHLLGRGHGFGDERRVSADQVHADLLGRAVERVREFDEVLGGLAGAGADERDRGDGDALVDDRDAVVAFDGLAGGDQILGVGGDLAVDVVGDHVHVGVGAVEQRDAHRDGADVELLLLDHLIGLMDLHDVQHVRVPFGTIFGLDGCVANCQAGQPSDAVHLGEDLLALAADLDADLLAEGVQVGDHRAEFGVDVRVIHNHHHVEEAVDDGLGNVKHVDVVFGQIRADAGDDADGVLADDGDDGLVHAMVSLVLARCRLIGYPQYRDCRSQAGLKVWSLKQPMP